MKQNDTIIANVTFRGITAGREYTAVSVVKMNRPGANDLVSIRDDRGNLDSYFQHRFTVKPSVQQPAPLAEPKLSPASAWPFPTGAKPAAAPAPAHVEKKKPVTPEDQLPPQCRAILRHLKTAGSITQREALLDLKVQSLTRRVTDLIDHGYDVKKDRREHPTTGQRYTRYMLAA